MSAVLEAVGRADAFDAVNPAYPAGNRNWLPEYAALPVFSPTS
jgi:hypothetical protein